MAGTETVETIRSYVPGSSPVTSQTSRRGWWPAASRRSLAAWIRYGSTSTLVTSSSARRWHARAVPYPLPQVTRMRESSARKACWYIFTISAGSVADEVGHVSGTTVPGAAWSAWRGPTRVITLRPLS